MAWYITIGISMLNDIIRPMVTLFTIVIRLGGARNMLCKVLGGYLTDASHK